MSSPAHEFENLLEALDATHGVGRMLELEALPDPRCELLRDLQQHLNERMDAELHRVVTPRGKLDALYLGYTNSHDVNAFAFQSQSNNRAFIAATIGFFDKLTEVAVRVGQTPAVLNRLRCKADRSSAVSSAIFSMGVQVMADHEL